MHHPGQADRQRGERFLRVRDVGDVGGLGVVNVQAVVRGEPLLGVDHREARHPGEAGEQPGGRGLGARRPGRPRAHDEHRGRSVRGGELLCCRYEHVGLPGFLPGLRGRPVRTVGRAPRPVRVLISPTLRPPVLRAK